MEAKNQPLLVHRCEHEGHSLFVRNVNRPGMPTATTGVVPTTINDILVVFGETRSMALLFTTRQGVRPRRLRTPQRFGGDQGPVSVHRALQGPRGGPRHVLEMLRARLHPCSRRHGRVSQGPSPG